MEVLEAQQNNLVQDVHAKKQDASNCTASVLLLEDFVKRLVIARNVGIILFFICKGVKLFFQPYNGTLKLLVFNKDRLKSNNIKVVPVKKVIVKKNIVSVMRKGEDASNLVNV